MVLKMSSKIVQYIVLQSFVSSFVKQKTDFQKVIEQKIYQKTGVDYLACIHTDKDNQLYVGIFEIEKCKHHDTVFIILVDGRWELKELGSNVKQSTADLIINALND